MITRFKMPLVQPEAYTAMRALEKYLSTSTIGLLQRELIKIRASQINGCAFCLNMHTNDARKHGETEQRVYLLSAWREAKNVYTAEEQLMLEMTEQITLIHRGGLSDEVYESAIEMFGEEKTAHIIMTIVAINGWNRISVSLRSEPEL